VAQDEGGAGVEFGDIGCEIGEVCGVLAFGKGCRWLDVRVGWRIRLRLLGVFSLGSGVEKVDGNP